MQKTRRDFPWTRVMISGYLIGCVGVGILGLVEPLSSEFGVDGTQMVYSWLMIMFGAAGLFAVPFNPSVVVRAVWVISAATLIHGTLVLLSGHYQTGFRLMIAPLMMVPAIWAWGQWLIVVKHVRRERRSRDAARHSS